MKDDPDGSSFLFAPGRNGATYHNQTGSLLITNKLRCQPS